MGQMNEGRYESWAARVLNVKGPGTLTHLENSLFAMVPLDAAGPVEFWDPQRIDRFSTRAQANAGGVGTYAGMQIRNLTDDQLYVIERVFFRPAATADIGFFIGQNIAVNTFATPYPGKALDTRNARFNTFVPGTFGTTGITTPTGHEYVCQVKESAANVGWVDFPAVIGPGGSFVVLNQVDNVALMVNIEFHTRSFVP